MTTQAELLDIAKKHQDNKAVSLILLAIEEARGTAKQNLAATSLSCNTFLRGVNFEEGYGIACDSASLAHSAAKAAAALATINSNLMTLACLLESLGEPIHY